MEQIPTSIRNTYTPINIIENPLDIPISLYQFALSINSFMSLITFSWIPSCKITLSKGLLARGFPNFLYILFKKTPLFSTSMNRHYQTK